MMKIDSPNPRRRVSVDTCATELTMNSTSSLGNDVSPQCNSITNSPACSHCVAAAINTAESKMRKSCLQVKTLEESLASANFASSHSGPKLKNKNRKVNFCCAEFREYEIVLGDHPCPRLGPPISLGWKHDPTTVTVVDVMDYEWDRPDLPRTRSQMLIPSETRSEMLLQVGFTWRQLYYVMAESKNIRRSREKIVMQYQSKNSKRKKIMKLFKGNAKFEFPIPRGWKINLRNSTAA